MAGRAIYIEIGAYLGSNVKRFFSKTQQADRFQVYAFEPHPENFKVLVDTVNANGWHNITCINKALTRKNSTMRLYVANDLLCKRASAYESKVSGELQAYRAIDVETINFDEWFVENTRAEDIVFMTINCEGGEYDLMTSIVETGTLGRIKSLNIKLHEHKVSEGTLRNTMINKKDKFLREVDKHKYWVDTMCKYRTNHGDRKMTDMVMSLTAINDKK